MCDLWINCVTRLDSNNLGLKKDKIYFSGIWSNDPQINMLYQLRYLTQVGYYLKIEPRHQIKRKRDQLILLDAIKTF